MKKTIALILAAVMCVFALAACNSSKDNAGASGTSGVSGTSAAIGTSADGDGDLAAIKAKGKLVIGITEYEPMNYQDKSTGKWTGFDTEYAEAVCEKLGVTAEFLPIEWDNKIFELNSGAIDCVWNGMTLTDEVKSSMNCTNAYLNNAQIVVVPADKADQYQTEDSLKDLNFAVEAGSAGEAVATEKGFNATPVKAQSDALMEVAAGTSDAAIIDSLMAAAMVGEGTGYENLTYTIGLSTEEYGVGFRQGSDLTDALNDFLKTSSADGTLEKIAETYGVQAALVDQQ